MIHRVAFAAPIALLVLAGCSSTGTADAPSNQTPTSAAPVQSTASLEGKEWAVDTSGWWVPGDPDGCLTETTTCYTSAWKSRAYRDGNLVANFIQHGELITLICKAPTPAPIRNSMKHESVYWYFSEFEGATYWVPDIYVTNDDVEGMASGVPDCDSDTPGING